MSVTTMRPPVDATPARRWALATDQRASGYVRVSDAGRALRVSVGSRPAGASSELPDPGAGLVTGVLDDGGSVVVETLTAPPALLVSRDGARLLPAAPGQCRPTRMCAGDRLILCSASALDAPPAGLVRILRAPAREVLDLSPRALLERLLDGVEDGAAAVVARADPPNPGR